MEDKTEASLGLCEFVQRYAGQIAGQLGCWDRLVVIGTLLDVGYSGALEKRLRQDDLRCFDLKVFAEPLREAMRDHAIKRARATKLEVEFIQRKNFRKEDRIAEIIARRGTAPGLVQVFSAMEPCTTFHPWHDKESGRTGLKPTSSECLHFYFYFIHERWGLCYLRVPTWLPFRLQFYCNGHAWLARELTRAGIDFEDSSIWWRWVLGVERNVWKLKVNSPSAMMPSSNATPWPWCSPAGASARSVVIWVARPGPWAAGSPSKNARARSPKPKPWPPKRPNSVNCAGCAKTTITSGGKALTIAWIASC